jgi:hypothetical protein
MKTRLFIITSILCCLLNPAYPQNNGLNKINQDNFPYYLVVKELKADRSFFTMYHDKGSWPIRIGYLYPTLKNSSFGSGNGIELSSVWCGNPRSFMGFRYQLSAVRFAGSEGQFKEEYIIPSVNLGFQLNFLGDCRFNFRPYTTAGWNPVRYRYDLTVSGQEGSFNHKEWFLNNWSWNCGLSFDFWFTNGFGISAGYEMTRYLADIAPALYKNRFDGLAMSYSTLKISLMF